MMEENSDLEKYLKYLWRSLDPFTFERLIADLLIQESVGKGMTIQTEEMGDYQADLYATVVLEEPNGEFRHEMWGFQLKYRTDRYKASEHLSIKAILKSVDDLYNMNNLSTSDSNRQVEIFCIVTNEELTNLAREYIRVIVIPSHNYRIRIWDRHSIDNLLKKHIAIAYKYIAPQVFTRSVSFVETFNVQDEAHFSSQTNTDIYLELKEELCLCPFGTENYRDFEQTGTKIWNFLFDGSVKKGKQQVRTRDGVQIRDVLFKIIPGKSEFWDRIHSKHQCDYIIVDFKNYSKKIDSDTVQNASLYGNNDVGRLIILMSRKGGASKIDRVIDRVYKESKNLVMIISDDDVIEMLNRKRDGFNPIDVLEDKYDKFIEGL